MICQHVSDFAKCLLSDTSLRNINKMVQ